MASIEIQGVSQLIEKLGRIEQAQDVLEPPMRRAGLRIQAAMAKYPTQRAGSSYRRTGTLGRRWVAPPPERSSNGIVQKIGNSTSYGPFVQSQMFQAAVHKGRWQTDEMVLKREQDAIVGDFERAIQRELDK